MDIGQGREAITRIAQDDIIEPGCLAQEGGAQIGGFGVALFAFQVSLAQIGPFEMGAAEIGSGQVSAAQKRILKMSAAQVGPFEMGAAQNGSFEMSAAQIGPFQTHGGQLALLVRCQIPLVRRQSALYGGQRQIFQARFAQVGPAQVQSRLHLVLGMAGQQPFYICAIQCIDMIPEGIAPLLGVGYGRLERLIQLRLARSVNLWLRAPGLPLRQPVIAPGIALIEDDIERR
jgi:hypothetical protein